MTATGSQLTIHCYHCGQPVQVGRKTQSTSCGACHQRLVVEDVVIARLTPVKQVRTCGRLVVKPKGVVIAELVQANGGIEMHGQLEANVVSGGPVLIGAKARWKGDCRAPSLVVEPGARIEGGRFAVPRPFPEPGVAKDAHEPASSPTVPRRSATAGKVAPTRLVARPRAGTVSAEATPEPGPATSAGSHGGGDPPAASPQPPASARAEASEDGVRPPADDDFDDDVLPPAPARKAPRASKRGTPAPAPAPDPEAAPRRSAPRTKRSTRKDG